jgi:hypothetical protein
MLLGQIERFTPPIPGQNRAGNLRNRMRQINRGFVGERLIEET